ncbi:hypothetical protein DL93DRAFT_2049827 [Clavulina sp. PMI_390]|nr:hypothetical protein DL93DRAFT_2049827 [Clavulina sp. PMI_390]
MPKRPREDEGSSEKRPTKKPQNNKTQDAVPLKAFTPRPNAPAPAPAEIDFPRGGGSSFTPLETKAIRAEAIKELNEEQIFQASCDLDKAAVGTKNAESDKDRLRIEHLNYKRLLPGQRILCQIVQILPLALVVSLPHQLLGHIPITHISSLFTERLEKVDGGGSDDGEEDNASEDVEMADGEAQASKDLPDLADMFYAGQFLTAIVEEVRPAGARGSLDFSKSRDETTKGAKRVELSIAPEKVNAGVAKRDLVPGFNISAVVKSVEDHGYILDTGVAGVSGFLSLKEASKGPLPSSSLASSSPSPRPLSIGQVINATVTKVSENGRTVTLSIDPSIIRSATVTELSSIGSVVPGTLVTALITSVLSWGLNVQLLGFFGGTIDLFHLSLSGTDEVDDKYKVGQKIRARVLWDVSSNNPKTFVLSTLDHVKSKSKAAKKEVEKGKSVKDVFPVGMVLESVRVRRVESEWGLVVEGPDGVQGFVHISQVSDEHVPSLSASTGPWKLNSTHRARVIAFSAFDGLLQLSLKPSTIEQQYLRPSDLSVGEILKGTVKKLEADLGLFIKLSEDVDGVVWPLHYSDIRLKHPERKFKEGTVVKCRVLSVDEERNRVTLTLKKSLIESDLPLIKSVDDATAGLVTHGVVAKIMPKLVIVNYFGGVRAIIPIGECSEEKLQTAESVFTLGQVVRTRILSIEPSAYGPPRIIASAKQAAPNFVPATSIASIEIGNVSTDARVVEVQKDNVAITLLPLNVRALVSINNLATARGVSAAKLRTDLHAGDEMADRLVVMSKNVDKHFVIVSAASGKKKAQPKNDDDLPSIDFSALKEGDIVKGKIVSHSTKQTGGTLGCTVRISNSVTGTLHPLDTSDDFRKNLATLAQYDDASSKPTPSTSNLSSIPYPPPIGAILDFAVLSIDRPHRKLVLSTRPSRLETTKQVKVVDPEIKSAAELTRGQKVRGLVKSVADAGLFISLGRSLHGRVQIKELFDEYVKDWKSRFSVNQVIEARVFKVNTDIGQVELTLRNRDLSEQSSVTFDDLVEGENVDAVVKKVELYGLFIEIKGTKISGLCHKSEISDNKKADVASALKNFKEGDPLRARILSVDAEKRRVNFGLKPSYFVDDPAVAGDDEEEEGEEEDEDTAEHREEEDDSNDEAATASENDQDDEDGDEDVDEDEDEDEDEDMEEDLPSANFASSSKPSLPSTMLELRRGFEWNSKGAAADDGDSDDESSDDDEADTGDAIKSRKKKKRHEIQKDFTIDMHTKAPESTDDFERHLLGSPNSSYLWIQYMSFQLQLSEIDKAREIGRRAIGAINFREEQERLNVWIARLNLENSYGTEESLEATFREAAKYHESKHMHLRLAAILEQTDKHEQAEELFKRTTKKFGQSSKVWTGFGEHYFRRNMFEEARKLLPRSLQSLDKRKHLKTISKFAQMEYKLGDPERGKTIYEGIVDSHPKRLDLWSVYVDMEAGQKNIQSIRAIFGRLFQQKLSSKKAKFFFKKWLALEKSIGDEEGVEQVKAKAIEWTQGSTSAVQA